MLHCALKYNLKVLLYYYCSWSLTLSRSRDKRRYAFTFSVLSILFCFIYSSAIFLRNLFIGSFLEMVENPFQGERRILIIPETFLRPFDWMALKRSAKPKKRLNLGFTFESWVQFLAWKKWKRKKIKNYNSLKQVYLLFLHHSKGQDSFRNAMK